MGINNATFLGLELKSGTIEWNLEVQRKIIQSYIILSKNWKFRLWSVV